MEAKKEVKKTVKTIINKMIDAEFLGWPPGCMGIAHQPIRPRVEEVEKENAGETEQ